MAKTVVEVSLVAQRHHHGGKPTQSRAVKSAAASKFRKTLGVTVSKPLDQAKADRDEARRAKPYGSHNGGTHSKCILKFETDGPVTSEQDLKVQNICNTFESFKSVDIKSKKLDHASKRQALNEKYREKYGDHLTQQQMTQYKNEYAKLSFVYWAQQIVIKITCDQAIEGGRQTSDGTWVVVLRTKTVYTLEMMPLQQAEALEKVGSGELTEEAKVFTNLTRTGGLFTTDPSGRLKLVPDRGDLLDVTDQY